MFCRVCLSRYLTALLVAYKFAQAVTAALVAGDVVAAYAYSTWFARLWRALHSVRAHERRRP